MSLNSYRNADGTAKPRDSESQRVSQTKDEPQNLAPEHAQHNPTNTTAQPGPGQKSVGMDTKKTQQPGETPTQKSDATPQGESDRPTLESFEDGATVWTMHAMLAHVLAWLELAGPFGAPVFGLILSEFGTKLTAARDIEVVRRERNNFMLSEVRGRAKGKGKAIAVDVVDEQPVPIENMVMERSAVFSMPGIVSYKPFRPIEYTMSGALNSSGVSRPPNPRTLVSSLNRPKSRRNKLARANYNSSQIRRASAPSKLPTIQERSAEDTGNAPKSREMTRSTSSVGQERPEQGESTNIGERRKSMSALAFDCGHIRPSRPFYDIEARFGMGGENEDWVAEMKEYIDSIISNSSTISPTRLSRFSRLEENVVAGPSGYNSGSGRDITPEVGPSKRPNIFEMSGALGPTPGTPPAHGKWSIGTVDPTPLFFQGRNMDENGVRDQSSGSTPGPGNISTGFRSEQMQSIAETHS
ncbi:hypothetical protein MKZ38_000942 [Zalerion maritima]|uniref:Uncharacterized protein n=1 Tax=Zalerion maritima TaxID=339359 RepID=A0AAD5RSC7_9PEZI|nr:hypothetical protein MKZ38_000942 [Zalerion maritima]